METDVPTLSQWAGGAEAIERLIDRFYARIAEDPELSIVFAGMSPHHAQYVAAFINEVFGGEKNYTGLGRSHSYMISRHLGRRLDERQRRRWVNLLLDTADEVDLPTDPEFRSAFLAYLEWGSRIAVLNSLESGNPTSDDAPMPTWGWGVPGGPFKG